MHTVQSYARESHESERFADAANRTYHTSRIRIQTQSLMTALVIVLIFGAITGVLWVGAKDVIAGNMSSGALGQFVLYAIIGAGSVGALTEVWNDVQRAAGGMSRIDRKSVVSGKRVSVRVDLGGGRSIKNKNHNEKLYYL